jgi:hypothetical protein
MMTAAFIASHLRGFAAEVKSSAARPAAIVQPTCRKKRMKEKE